MSEIKFDRNIPIPPVPKRSSPYRLGDMRPGDSRFVPGRTTGNLTAPSHFARRNPGWQFTVRNVVENGVKGVRYWCVRRPNVVKIADLPISKTHKL